MTYIKKGTPEWDVLLTTIDIAAAAPRRQGQAYAAGVPWKLIHQLRRELEAMGIDWKSLLPKQEKKTYAKHQPTDKHLYDDPSEPLLCTCGVPLRFYNGTYGKRGWACSNLSGPTAAFADIPEPEGR